MKKYIMEFIGTFFLVFAIGNVICESSIGIMGPIAIGCTLMGVIYAGGHISKAHYNPAITLAFLLRRGMKRKDVPGYLAGEILGASLAMLTCLYLYDFPELPSLQLEIGPTLIVEFLGTFVLAFVIMNVATAKALANNGFYGLAIAATVVGLVYAVAPISGAGFNPAVSLTLLFAGLLDVPNLILHIIAQFVGGAAAAYTYLYLVPDEE
ncbi:MAG: aquaporin [Verrucomicrobiota bacterium]